jgi:hypothetical protein
MYSMLGMVLKLLALYHTRTVENSGKGAARDGLAGLTGGSTGTYS